MNNFYFIFAFYFVFFTEPVKRIPVHRDASVLYILTFREPLLYSLPLSFKINIFRNFLDIKWPGDQEYLPNMLILA